MTRDNGGRQDRSLRPDGRAVRSMLNEFALEILCDLFPANGRVIGAEFVVGSLSDTSGSSLKYDLRKHVWCDWGGDGEDKGDILDLVARYNGWTKGQAWEWGLARLGLNSPVALERRRPVVLPPMEEPSPRDKAHHTRQLDRAADLWHAARPIDGTLGESYFRWRGIAAALPKTLRFAPALPYWLKTKDGYVELGRFPAIIARLTYADIAGGGFAGVHRIYLRPDGLGKAEVVDPETGEVLSPKKLACPSPKGAGLWWGEPGASVVVTEGIENAGAAVDLYGRDGLVVTAVAAVSAVGVAHLDLPACVRMPVLLPDNDEPRRNRAGEVMRDSEGEVIRPGLQAAKAAKARWLAEKLNPKIVHITAKGPDGVTVKDVNEWLRVEKGLPVKPVPGVVDSAFTKEGV